MKEYSGNIVIVNGDVLSRADDYPDIEEYRERRSEDVDADLLGFAQRTATERSKHITSENIPAPAEKDPVMEVVETAALYENKLRSLGVAASRIESLAHRPMSRDLAKLQVHGADTSKAYPPVEPPAPELQDSGVDTAREARIEALMNGTGLSYDEASRRV